MAARSNPITVSRLIELKGRIGAAALPALTAKVAREALAEVQAQDPAPYRQYVDGREGATLESVRPGGVILFRFSRAGHVIDWIYARLLERSPVLTGAYQNHHWLYVNGRRIDVHQGQDIMSIPPGTECMLVNTIPYARKVEGGGRFAKGNAGRKFLKGSGTEGHSSSRRGGHSTMAPDGVYEITAREARSQFPSADIRYEYRAVEGASTGPKGNRWPAIIVASPE